MRTVLLLAAVLALSLVGEAGAVATSYLPAEHRAYDFLSRMELQQAVNGVRLGTRPMTRARVAELLMRVKENEDSLSPVDRDELSCLMDEFAPDIPARKGLVWDDRGPVDRLPGFLGRFAYRNRRNLFSATGEEYSLYIDPIIVRSATVGTMKTAEKDDRIYLDSNGFVIRGTAGGHVGFILTSVTRKSGGVATIPPSRSPPCPAAGMYASRAITRNSTRPAPRSHGRTGRLR